jgi:hypothetical protein
MRRIASVILIASSLSVIMACSVLAGTFEDSVDAIQRSDYKTAFRLSKPLAEKGNVSAQYNLGVMYSKGLGVQRNDSEAVKWYQKAADSGLPDAQFNLGVMYYYGQGVPRDYVQSYKWFDITIARLPASEYEKIKDAKSKREFASYKMTPTQITEAQRLVKEWHSNNIFVPPPPPLNVGSRGSEGSIDARCQELKRSGAPWSEVKDCQKSVLKTEYELMMMRKPEHAPYYIYEIEQLKRY